MNRRKFIKRSIWSIAGFGFANIIYAWQVEPYWCEFTHVIMPIKNLPAHLNGKILMQISDIHISASSVNYIKETFQTEQQYNPHFVVYTGDFITATNGEISFEEVESVLNHCVKGTLGTAAILGNHDYGEGWKNDIIADKISEIIASQNINVLRNSIYETNGLNFIGIDDYWGTNFHPEKVLNHINNNQANIVLCHNPDVCDLDIWQNYSGWILSGHTHGGQVKPPFLPPPLLPVKNKKYTNGHFQLSGKRNLYINRGLGYLKQFRWNARPEITIFEMALGEE